MPEETEVITEQAQVSPEAVPSEITQELAGEGAAPKMSEAGVEEGKETTSPTQDPDVELEIGGKTFTMKQSEAVQVLENASKLAEREKQLTEKEKSFNRFNTQEGQRNAAFKKSVETAFGRYPEASELQALGKIWNAYFKNPEVKQTIDQILSGNLNRNGKPKTQEGDGQYVSQLEQKISELEERLEGFVSSTTEERNAQEIQKAETTWKSWVAKQAEAKITISEDVEGAMIPFITALKRAHPEWDDNKVLDEAYRHTTIGDLEKSAVGKVLKSAESAKKGTVRITPKQPAQTDQSKGYKDIFLESQR